MTRRGFCGIRVSERVPYRSWYIERMTYLIILAALVVVPVLAILALKVNAAIAFMSLCVGSVLVTYTSGDVTSLLSDISPKHTLATTQWSQLALLVVPFVLAVLFTRKSISGSKQFTNIFPAVASGLLFALLVTPLLASSLQRSLKAQGAWHQLSNLQTAVILGGAAFSLLFLLVSHRHHRSDSKHGK
jgi:hypothetical protein